MDTKEELFKKIYIKTEADLPKEDGNYYTHSVLDNRYLYKIWFNRDSNIEKELWLTEIDWYLQPIEEKEENPYLLSGDELKRTEEQRKKG